MPAGRTKSCSNCRTAKARCSLSVPCSRCAKRHLECHYTPTKPHHHENRRIRLIRPATDTHAKANPLGPSDPAEFTDSFSSIGNICEEVDNVPSTTYPPSAELVAYPANLVTHDSNASKLLSQALPNHIASLDSPFQYYGPGDISFLGPLSPSWFLNLDNLSDAGTPTFEKSCDPQWLSAPSRQDPSTKVLEPQLSLRARTLQQGSLTSKMVFSKLSEYTRMLADGKHLPPFILPPCSVVHGNSCASDTPHSCLPGTLSTCTFLTRSFHGESPESRVYVWQQICAHLQQIQGEFEAYDEQKMLEAMQATVVYGMLCSQSTEWVPRDDAAWIVATIETLGLRLYDVCSWIFDAAHLCTIRSEWILMESMRRIGCILYFFDLLLQTDAQGPSSGECEDFFDMPLPCAREIWQSASDAEWEKRYHSDIESKKPKGRQGLTFRHLIMFRRSSLYAQKLDENWSSGLADECAEWCERVDDLGMLLWMALTVEGAGQAPEISRTELAEH